MQNLQTIAVVLTLASLSSVAWVVWTFVDTLRPAYRYKRAKSWSDAIEREFHARYWDPNATDLQRRAAGAFKQYERHEAEFMDGKTVSQIMDGVLFGGTPADLAAWGRLKEKRRELVMAGGGGFAGFCVGMMGLLFDY